MKRFFLLFLVFSSLLAAELVFQPMTAPRIQVDGRLDEPIWTQTRFVDAFCVVESDKPASRRTEVGVVATETALVFGFRAYVPASEIKTDGLFSECVEVMLDPLGDSDTYYHFAVGANGERFDRKCEQSGYLGDKSYDSGFQAKVSRSQEYWTAEIAIPYRSLELRTPNPAYWSVNCTRESNQLSSIGEMGRFNIKGSFRKMAPPKVDLTPFLWEVGEPAIKSRLQEGKLQVSCAVTARNLGGKDRVVTPSLMWIAPDGTRRPITLLRQEISAGGSVEIAFPETTFANSGKYQVEVALRDQATNRLLTTRRASATLDFTPMALKLVDPHYRNAIFATQKLDKVRFQVTLAETKPGARIRGTIKTANDGKPLFTQTVPASAKQVFECEVSRLPEGKMVVMAELLDAGGKTIATTQCPLRKLAYRKGEVWRGKNRNWYIDGKKVFLLLSWNNVGFYYPEFLAVLNGDGTYPQVLDITALGFGLKSKGFGLDTLMKKGITPAAEEFFRNRIRGFMKHTKPYFAHYWLDEPDGKGVTPDLVKKVVDIAAEEDPWHPVIISTGTKGVIAYTDTAEINAFHCYPHPEIDKPMSNFKKIVICMDMARNFFKDDVQAQTITYLHQGFNYGEHNARNSRIPSYEEYRSQDLLGLILGAQGLCHYNVFVGDYPELQVGIGELVKEQKLVGEEAIIQTPLKVESPSPSLRLRAFRNEQTGAVWLLACNVEYVSNTFDFTFKEAGDAPLQVLSEGRTVNAKNGRIHDAFRPFEVHVYTTDRRDFGLKTVTEIVVLIDNAYAARKKPGNLAWQRREEERLEVTASSNAAYRVPGPASNQLWHVTDGVIVPRNPRGGCSWKDATPKNLPDWIALRFQKPQTIGRVVVYPDGKSLKDYQVQVRLGDGAWETVGSVAGGSGETREFRFTPRKADAVRIWITGNHGAHSMISEIEVYEK